MTTRKNRIQVKIHEYRNRRKALQLQYPDWRTGNPEYQTRVKTINYSIKLWLRKVARIDKKEAKLKVLHRMVCRFMDIPTLWRQVHNRDPRITDARRLFCTLAVENATPSFLLADFLGHKQLGHPWKIRRKFKQSFKTDPYNRELWNRFKVFITEEAQVKRAA